VSGGQAVQTGQVIPLACGHAHTVQFNDPKDRAALFFCGTCDGLRAALPADTDPGEDEDEYEDEDEDGDAMGPGTALLIVSDAIPARARTAEVEAALDVLHRLAEGTLNESESI
jgi:hypothetical protein